jgi:hypothetical protein
MLGELSKHFRRALWLAFRHNAFTIAKAAAYSELLSLFPALLVAAALLAVAPEGNSVRSDIRTLLYDVLPPDTMTLVHNYFAVNPARSRRLVISASIFAIAAANGVLLSLMEGFRRAYNLPPDDFGFWRERLVSALLIPSTLGPMLCATALVLRRAVLALYSLAHCHGHQHHRADDDLSLRHLVEAAVAAGAARGHPGHLQLVCLDHVLRLVCHALRGLFAGLWPARRRHRYHGLAVHRLTRSADRRRIQRSTTAHCSGYTTRDLRCVRKYKRERTG